MGVGKSHGLADGLKNRYHVQRRAGLNEFIQGFSLNQFHGQKRPSILEFSHLIHGGNAGMLQLRGNTRFIKKNESPRGSREQTCPVEP